jgi:hypothetical protein
LPSVPPVAVTSDRVKAIGASLKTKLTVAVGLATFTSRLSIETVTVGVTTSASAGICQSAPNWIPS